MIVCFEALEHISNQETLLKEVKRLLKEDGIFIVSTPNKPVYSENGTRQNPFHLKELERSEFETLLNRYFKQIALYGQKSYASSQIFLLEASEQVPKSDIQKELQFASRIIVKKGGDGFKFVDEEDPLPRYFIAIASNFKIDITEEASYLTDISIREGYIKWEVPCENVPKPSKFGLLNHYFNFLYRGFRRTIGSFIRFVRHSFVRRS